MPVVLDVPGVGKNLQDHLNVNVLQRAQARRHARQQKPRAGLGAAGAAIRAAPDRACHQQCRRGRRLHRQPRRRRRRPTSSSISSRRRWSIMPARSSTATALPCMPAACGRKAAAKSGWLRHDPLKPPVMRSQLSRRRLRSEDPDRRHRRGRDIWRRRRSDRISATNVFRAPAQQSDAALAEFIRASAETEYHPVGTCKMGERPDGGGRRAAAGARRRRGCA